MTSLNPTMTIGDQIAESVRLHRGASGRTALDRAVEVLGLVGMPRARGARSKDYPHQLSGGMRQRVMIAMALACEPKLLIADEPTTALDVTIQKQILELHRRPAQRGWAWRSSWSPTTWASSPADADRVAVMYAGRVVETPRPQALFANPRHPYTEALFEALPEPRSGANRAAVQHPGHAAGPDRAARRAAGSPRAAATPRTMPRGRAGAGPADEPGASCRRSSRSPTSRGADDARAAVDGADKRSPPWLAAAARTAHGRDGRHRARCCSSTWSRTSRVTAGGAAAAQDRRRSARWPTCQLRRCRRARPSAWSASPAAARPRRPADRRAGAGHRRRDPLRRP